MLATPLLPGAFQHQLNGDDSSYRPARDKEAFNSLLPPPIEFIQSSQSNSMAVAEGKYQPINVTPKTTPASNKVRTSTDDAGPSSPAKSPKTPLPSSSSSQNSKHASLYPGALDLTWPQGYNVGSGLHNTGNTCFLNSALQCLLHTPPLLRILSAHSKADPCRVKSGFCMSCSLRQVMQESHSRRHPFTPYPVTSKLQLIAKSMRRGRQEDAHEFLRYAVDALQRSCLSGYPPKMDPKLAETTWIHKLFGGRLRSRVTCRECGHNSDTYDRILDLSLDIYGSSSLREALRKFVAVEYLRGQDKYKCEKCKKPVVAEKKFNVHEAPVVLTIHLKRFSPLGRKIGHFIHYDEHLALQPAMSEDSYGPSYTLYGVICHAGGGPNSGHYYAYVKSSNGQWYEMNDDMVAPSKVAVGMKNAYILFYMQDKGQSLEAAIIRSTPAAKNNVIAGMKKRKAMDDDEDVGTKASQPFIGPLLPSPVLTGSESKRSKPSPPDPQAATVKKKIEVAKAATALSALSQYDDEDDADADGGDGSKTAPTASKEQDTDCGNGSKKFPTADKERSAASTPAAATPPPSDTASSSTVPTSSFYGSASELPEREASSHNRHKTPASDNERSSSRHFARQPLHASSPKQFSKHKRKSFSGGVGNPYSSIGSSNLHRSDTRHGGSKPMQHYGKKRPRMLI